VEDALAGTEMAYRPAAQWELREEDMRWSIGRQATGSWE
jgi:hypothetical protein